MFKLQKVTGIWSLGHRLNCAVLYNALYIHVDYILASRYPWRQVLDRGGEQLITGHNLHIYLEDGYAQAVIS